MHPVELLRERASTRSRVRGTIMVYFQCFPPGLRNDRFFGTKSTDGAFVPVFIVPRTPLRARVSFPARQLCYRTEWADRRL
jgi:hypothetical protein